MSMRLSGGRRHARRYPGASRFALVAVLSCLGALLLYALAQTRTSHAPAATFRTTTPHGTLANAHSNMRAVASLGFDFVTVSAWPEELDRAQAAGLKVLVWLGGFDYTKCRWN